MSANKIEILERALAREKQARKEAEKILEIKALELYQLSEKLKESNNTLESLLAKKNLELKGVFKNIVDAYCLMDMYGNVLEMNDATFKLLGCKVKTEHINLSKFVFRDDAPKVLNAFNQLKIDGDLKDLIIRVISEDKILKHIHINASLIFNSNGKPIAVQGIARDITQEQKNKKDLAESESRLKALIENLDYGVLLEDENRNIVLVNNQFCNLFSIPVSPEQMVGQDCSNSAEHSKLLFKNPEKFISDINFLLKNKKQELGCELIMANGNIIKRDFIPIFYNNKYKGHLWTYKNVTEIKLAQQNLIESENRLKTLILNLDSGILLEDENCNIIFTNNKFCELFSIEDAPEQLKGQHCSDRMQNSMALFEQPEYFITRMQTIVGERNEVLAEELKMLDGKILERDYIPIYDKGNYKGHLWTYRDVTLRRNYNKNIEAERHKYSSIIANMNLGLVEADTNNQIVMVNQSFIDISGYTEKELLGMNAIEVLIPETDKESIVQLADDTRAGKSNSLEMRIKNKKGEIRSLLTSSAPNYDENGHLVGSIGVILDITEQAKTKSLLIEQKKQLDLIVQNSPVGIALFKKQGEDVLMVNKSLCNMFGYSEEELMNKFTQDPTHPDDMEISLKNRNNLEAGKIDKFSIEKRYFRKDGSILWARTNVNAIRDYSGNVINQVAIVEDITAQREKTLMLDTLNNVAKSILGKVDIYDIAMAITQNITNYLGSKDCVIYLVDNKKNILNQIAAYGTKVDNDGEIIGQIEIPFGKGIVGHVAKFGEPLIIGDTSKDSRYIIDDEIRYSEISVPIINDGKVIGVIDSEHDDKNYFTEEHLATLKNVARLVSMQLKNAINSMQRDKAEAYNIQLLKELEASNSELEEYAHIVSHDLKSPLRSISALVSWIKEDNLDHLSSSSLDNIGLIETTLEKMEQLISDVLNYSSITSDVVENQHVDLNVLINELKQTLFVPKNTQIKVLNKLPTIYGDKTRFQQLFQNLLSNAIKFMDKDIGNISIEVIEHSIYWQFAVSDNGIGIEKEYHNKIFEMFHSLNQSKESSGIGLTIVKKIIDLYQGEIWLESEPGVGTTFHFTLKKQK